MTVTILKGDCRDVLATLPDESVHCVVTSPPYWGLRDYGVPGQIGLELTPTGFVDELLDVFRELRRVLRSDGTAWLNLGDSYAGGGRGGNPEESPHRKQATNTGSVTGVTKNKWPIPDGVKPKDLVGIPWRVAFALQADGWWLRQDIIWSKPNPMPESIKDRCTKAHEYLFLLTKAERYWYDADAIKEDGITGDPRRPYGSPGANVLDPRNKQGEGKPRSAGIQHKQTALGQQWGGYLGSNDPFEKRNKRSVWEVATQAFGEAHFATFPPALIEPCILAGCPKGGTVLDPFGGAGTTGLVADRLERNAILIELNPEYAAMAERRIKDDAGMFANVK